MPNSVMIDLGGLVHVARHGGEGRPILLVHGLGGSYVNWSAVADPLTAHGAVTAMDLIGFGRTPPAGRSSKVRNQRDLVISFLQAHAEQPAVLIGNSMGGLVSMMVAEAAPDAVESLVLVDPALPVVRPRLDTGVLRRLVLPLVPGIGPRSFQHAYAQAIDDPERFVEDLLEVLFADPSRMRAEDRDQALAMAAYRAGLPWSGEAFVDAARSMFAILVRGRTFAHRVRAIEAPALVIHGDRDRLVDVASARWLVRQRPGWMLEVFEGVGHVPQLESPERFLAAVGSWLEEPGEVAEAS